MIARSVLHVTYLLTLHYGVGETGALHCSTSSLRHCPVSTVHCRPLIISVPGEHKSVVSGRRIPAVEGELK